MAARAVYDLAVESGVGLVAGGLLETAVGRTHALSFARLPGFTAIADLAPPCGYLEADLANPSVVQTHGTVEVGAGPGIGFDPDPDLLDRYRAKSETIELGANH